ncbi:hypothetical protein [Actinomyces vulturis]|uniref:hypothetical protein n=1 Tax=Actinomyces vulturis TaxID=1857645 RepID=UPI00082C097F|nr:hypothetical protein [Actinomyces vulturis]
MHRRSSSGDAPQRQQRSTRSRIRSEGPTHFDGTRAQSSRGRSHGSSQDGQTRQRASVGANPSGVSQVRPQRGSQGAATQRQSKPGRSSRQPQSSHQGRDSRGPHRPQRPAQPNYVLRRTIAVIIVVALMAAAVWAVMQGMKALSHEIQRQDQEAAASSVQTFWPAPSACVASALDAQIDAPIEVKAGEPVTVTVTMTNKGTEACVLDTGSKHFNLIVTSGEATLWDAMECVSEEPDHELLVSPGEAANPFTITWPGTVKGTSCDEGGPKAKAGTYRLQLTMDGKPVGDPKVLVLK